jgi:type I restriction enzyme S subunit
MSFYKMASLNPFSSWVSAEMISEVRIDGYYYDYKFIELEKKLKMTDFEIVCLGDLFNVITDGDHEKRDYVLEGIPFYTVRDIEEFQINDNNDLFISEADHVRLKRSKLEPNNLLITKTGRVGTTAVVPRMKKKGNISADVAILKSAKKAMDEHYLGTYLNSRYGQLAILRLNYGSTRPRITLKDIPKVQVLVPSIEIQKYIGDKVRRAEELREEAKAAKKDYEYIIQDIYSDSNTIKFPKGFYTVQSHDFDDKHLRIDSNFYNPLYKNGKLNSYKNVKLSKLVDLKKNCKIQAEEEYAYFEIGDLSTSNILDEKERVKGSELPGRAKLKLEKNDIIVSLVQESIEVTSYVDKELNNTLTTNGCAVLIPRDKSLSGYLYAIISSKYFIAQKCRYISGTNIRSMSKDDLLDMKIPIVEDEIITKVNGLVLKEFTCLRESKQLIQEAKQDVEDLIEGKFDMSKLNNESSTESRC